MMNNEEKELEKLVGTELFRQIRVLFGGTNLYIKQPDSDDVKYWFFKKNIKIKEIAKMLNISESNVYKILNNK